MSHDPITLTSEKLAAIVAAIPPGHWMSYGDVVAAGDGGPRQVLGVNARLVRLACPGAHRVLKADGTISGSALGDPPSAGGRGRRLRGRSRRRRRAPQARRPGPGRVSVAPPIVFKWMSFEAAPVAAQGVVGRPATAAAPPAPAPGSPSPRRRG
ncbi:MAG TPA: MGMT family protein [Baekduia sp.]|uniref:MGMT family protein n=1 Tax=Baekduia sp. TaxID=2600305 RepID=UPI002D77797D|nr:MGMT family protein [Baekduia sp.]HET6508649.1 MGMT family protein [Baekduia sp.]